MKTYLTPDFEAVRFSAESVLTPSGNESGIIPRTKSVLSGFLPDDSERKNPF